MESVYEIGIELICNTGSANLYNFGRKATQYDFKALKFKSISILYLKHMLISSCNAMAQGAINPIRFGLFQTAKDPGGARKAPPPPTISKIIVSIFTISYMCILLGVSGMFQLEFLKNSRF